MHFNPSSDQSSGEFKFQLFVTWNKNNKHLQQGKINQLKVSNGIINENHKTNKNVKCSCMQLSFKAIQRKFLKSQNQINVKIQNIEGM